MGARRGGDHPQGRTPELGGELRAKDEQAQALDRERAALDAELASREQELAQHTKARDKMRKRYIDKLNYRVSLNYPANGFVPAASNAACA